MSDPHRPGHDAHGTHDAHAGPDLKLYMMVFAILCVCTGLSFVVNAILGQNQTSMMVIMVVAIIKAAFVAAIFMHLKFDWARVYFIMVPVVILAIMMMIVLLPDFVLAWHHD